MAEATVDDLNTKPEASGEKEENSHERLHKVITAVKDLPVKMVLAFPLFIALREKMEAIEELGVGTYRSENMPNSFGRKIRLATGFVLASDFEWDETSGLFTNNKRGGIDSNSTKKEALARVGIGYSENEELLFSLKRLIGFRSIGSAAKYGILTGTQIGSVAAAGLVVSGVKTFSQVIGMRLINSLASPILNVMGEIDNLLGRDFGTIERLRSIGVDIASAGAGGCTTFVANVIAKSAVEISPVFGLVSSSVIKLSGLALYLGISDKLALRYNDNYYNGTGEKQEIIRKAKMFSVGASAVLFFDDWLNLRQRVSHQVEGVHKNEIQYPEQIEEQIRGKGAQMHTPNIHAATPHNIPEYAVSPTEKEIPVHLTTIEQIQTKVDSSGYDMTNPTNKGNLDTLAQDYIKKASPGLAQQYPSKELVVTYASYHDAPPELVQLAKDVRQNEARERAFLDTLNHNRPTEVHTVNAPDKIIHLRGDLETPKDIAEGIKNGTVVVDSTFTLGELGDNKIDPVAIKALGEFDPRPLNLQFQTPPHLQGVVANINTDALKELADLPKDPHQAADKIMSALGKRVDPNKITNSVTAAPTSPSEIAALTESVAATTDTPVHAATSNDIAAEIAYLWRGKDTTGLNQITVNGNVPVAQTITPEQLEFIRNIDMIFGGPGVVQTNPNITPEVLTQVAQRFGVYFEPEQMRMITTVFKNPNTQIAIERTAFADPVHGAVDAPGSNMRSFNKLDEVITDLKSRTQAAPGFVINLNDNDTIGKKVADAIGIARTLAIANRRENPASINDVQVSIYADGIYQKSVPASTFFTDQQLEVISNLPDSAFQSNDTLTAALAQLNLSDQQMRLPEIIAHNPNTLDQIVELWSQLKGVLLGKP